MERLRAFLGVLTGLTRNCPAAQNIVSSLFVSLLTSQFENHEGAHIMRFLRTGKPLKFVVLSIASAALAAIAVFSFSEPRPVSLAEDATAADKLRVTMEVFGEAMTPDAHATTQENLDRATECCWNPNTTNLTDCSPRGVCATDPKGKCYSKHFIGLDLADDQGRVSCEAMRQ